MSWTPCSLVLTGSDFTVDDRNRSIRATVMSRLGLRYVVEAGIGRTTPRAVTTGAGRRQPKRISDPAVAPTHTAIFRGHQIRSFPERSLLVES